MYYWMCEFGFRWSLIAAQLPGRTDNDVKNHWNTKLKKKFLAENTVATSYNNGTLSNTSSSHQFSCFATQPQVEASLLNQKQNSAWFDPYNTFDLEQTPISVPLPMPQELEAFDTGGSSYSAPPSKEVSMPVLNAASLAQQNKHTEWFGYDYAGEDDPNLLEFVLDDLLINHGFESPSCVANQDSFYSSSNTWNKKGLQKIKGMIKLFIYSSSDKWNTSNWCLSFWIK